MRHRPVRPAVVAVAVALLATGVQAARAASDGTELRDGSVYAVVSDTEVVLGNALVERRWSRDAFATTALVDKRGADRAWSSPVADFTLTVAGLAPLSSEQLRVDDVTASRLERGGLRVELHLTSPVLDAVRVVEAYPGVAGFRTATVLEPRVPLTLRAASLDGAAVGGAVTPTLHAFRAGADWREPGWSGPQLAVGDPHAGTWRDTRTGPAGVPLEGPAQWLSVRDPADRSLFLVMERNDLPSSRASYDGNVASLVVDYSRDVISGGPFEEQIHAENPTDGPGRQRVLAPGTRFALESSFLGFGRDADDEPWQFAKYLRGHRLAPYSNDVVFNSNGTDADRISTGAKDDMDIATVREVAPIARALGVETFVLDDGWQAISGDWYPDSPEHPEPRWDGAAGSKFAPRFPDAEFRAVREAIAPMKLGLWMSPMHFNPASQTYRAHPEWACAPLGHGLAAYNAMQPDSGSNEAGLGTWGPAAIPHVESRIREAVERWGVEYFKFDFLVWLDCAGQGDLYDYQDAFVGMLDRLRASYPDVTFQIDETNDYRLFPFASVARGPSWFQNGAPGPDRLLHNLWNLAPWVPVESLGQHALGGDAWKRYPVDTLMAAAMPSHVTFFSDLRTLPAAVVERAGEWTAFHSRHRDLLAAGVTYPLLDDPLAGGWTALQSWDPERGQGALLAFRQGAPDAVRAIGLRNVPDGRTFDLYAAPSGEHVATVTSAQLQQGLEVAIPDPNGARVLLVVPRP